MLTLKLKEVELVMKKHECEAQMIGLCIIEAETNREIKSVQLLWRLTATISITHCNSLRFTSISTTDTSQLDAHLEGQR